MGDLGLRTARRAKVPGNLPRVSGKRGAIVIHAKRWMCSWLNNTRNFAISFLKFWLFVDYVMLMWGNIAGSPCFYVCTASDEKLGGAWSLEWGYTPCTCTCMYVHCILVSTSSAMLMYTPNQITSSCSHSGLGYEWFDCLKGKCYSATSSACSYCTYWKPAKVQMLWRFWRRRFES